MWVCVRGQILLINVWMYFTDQTQYNTQYNTIYNTNSIELILYKQS